MFAILIIYLSFFSGKSYSAFLFLLEQHIAKRKHETGLELLSSYPPDFFPLQTFNHISEMCTCTYFSLFVLRNAERDDDGGFYCSISTQLHSYCFFEPVCETMDSRKFNFSPKLITLLERTRGSIQVRSVTTTFLLKDFGNHMLLAILNGDFKNTLGVTIALSTKRLWLEGLKILVLQNWANLPLLVGGWLTACDWLST